MRPLLLSDPVHFSNLRQLGRSPAHYAASILEPREQTAAMARGEAIHVVVLGQPYVVWSGNRRDGKKWEEFSAEHAGTKILTTPEYAMAMRCADAIGANPDATRVLVGQHEVERDWSILGRRCAGTPDVLGDGYVTELKTTSNAHPATFLRGALRMGYHAQLPWYLDGVGMSGGDAYIVVVETSAPFAVTVMQLTRRTLEEGRKLCRLWMEQLLNCEAANEWPAYCQSIVPFDIPDSDEPLLLIDGEEVAA